jgi:hypothetical protein
MNVGDVLVIVYDNSEFEETIIREEYKGEYSILYLSNGKWCKSYYVEEMVEYPYTCWVRSYNIY